MGKFIIDCGGWKADSIEPLRKHFDPEGTAIIHTFEACPDFFSCYDGIENHELHTSAVWIYDGKINFYLQDNCRGDGHSLLKEKQNENYPILSVIAAKPVTVPCIDFSKWIINNFSKDDEIYLKMNIEGAEYKVLDKMIVDGSIEYIKSPVIISFHAARYPKISTLEEEEILLKRLSNCNIKLWDQNEKRFE